MQGNDYQADAVRTCADPEANRYGQLATDEISLVIHTIEFAGFVGTLADALKKQLFHGHGLNRDKLKFALEDVHDGLGRLNNVIATETSSSFSANAQDALYLCNLLGLVGESGELAAEFAFGVEAYSPVLRDKVKKELGDILWYVAVAAETNGFTLDEVMEANVAKLRQRYPDGFAVADSLERKDV